jgi:hypothetical protein
MDSTADGIALRNEDFYKNNDIDIQKNKQVSNFHLHEILFIEYVYNIVILYLT